MPDLLAASPLNDQLTRGLSCAALNAALGSVLVFDLQADHAPFVADTFAQLIAAASGQKVSRVFLRSGESDDELWGSFALSGGDASTPLVWKPGLLSPAQTDEICLVVIPSLERVDATVARALVAMVGADVVNVERYGRQREWWPRFYWIAGCAGNATGKLSLHLLDRFALRLQSGKPRRPDASELLQWLQFNDVLEQLPNGNLSQQQLERVMAAAGNWPSFADAAFSRVLDYEGSSPSVSPRRGVALCRLAHTLARLAGAPEVLRSHIDEAARLVGLSVASGDASDKSSTSSPAPPDSMKGPAAEKQDPKDKLATSPTVEPVTQAGNAAKSESIEQTVTSSPTKELPAAPLAAPLDPYREDKQPSERESASLRLPFHRSRQTSETRGVIVGTQPARTLHDLALVETLFEAAKFQTIRRRFATSSPPSRSAKERIRIAASDLRGNRRAPLPEQLLMLLLDHTCLAGRRWLESLLPQFKHAYVNRARICLIQVGAATAGNLLRADRQTFNSVLVPGLAAALDAAPGKATPLAHGLELALQTMRHALQHGRQITHSAQFVVVTDGRGNVPLKVSIAGKFERSTGHEGIEDAVRIARQIRTLDRVDIHFFDPQPSSQKRLVSDLAEAFGVVPREIPLVDDVPVEEAV